MELRGTHHDTYFVLPTTTRTTNNAAYPTTSLPPTADFADILQKTLPIYLLSQFWLVSSLSCEPSIYMKQNLERKLHLSEKSCLAILTDKDRFFQILCLRRNKGIQHSRNDSLLESEGIAIKRNITFSVI